MTMYQYHKASADPKVSNAMKESRDNYSDGRDLYSNEDYEAAFGKFDKAVRMQEVLLGKFHKDTVQSYWWLGKAACHTQSEPTEALKAFHRAVRTGQVALGKAAYAEMLQDIEESLASCGWSHSFKKQQSSPAITKSSSSGSMRSLSLHGTNFPSNRSLNGGARRSLRSSFLRNSVNHKKKHMKILQDIVSHEQEGDKYFKEGRFSKATGHYSKALELQDQTMGTDSLDGADIRCKMAYSMLKDSATKQEARKSLQVAYECYIDKVGMDHPATYGVAAKIKTIVA